MSSLLSSAGVGSIDFFSLDTEGSELEVLLSMEPSVPVSVLVVELDGYNRTKDDAVRRLLSLRGMRFVRRMGFRAWNELWLGGGFVSGCEQPGGRSQWY